MAARPHGDVKILTASAARDLARRHAIRPSRALGQNFVIDPNTIRRVVRLAGVIPQDRVVEVGAGLGTLTLGLAEIAERVVAIEVDRRILPALTEVVGGLANVEIVVGDALRLDYRSILGGTAHRFISNLPYNIATPLLTQLLEEVPVIEDFVAMVQREVGERLVASPGSRTYGAVSVLVAFHCEAMMLGRVPATVFWPAPEVESVLVRLVRRPPPVGISSVHLMRVVRAAFSQRRKTVRNALASALGLASADIELSLAAAGVPAAARAESLGIEEFARIAQELIIAELMPGEASS